MTSDGRILLYFSVFTLVHWYIYIYILITVLIIFSPHSSLDGVHRLIRLFFCSEPSSFFKCFVPLSKLLVAAPPFSFRLSSREDGRLFLFDPHFFTRVCSRYVPKEKKEETGSFKPSTSSTI